MDGACGPGAATAPGPHPFGGGAVGKKFDRLASHVAREYEAKGIDKAKAEAWGAATAAKVARSKEPAAKEGGGK